MMRWRPSAKVSRSTEPDLVPRVGGERLGRQHEGVDGRQRAGLPAQGARVALGRADDDLRSHRATSRAHDSRLDGLDRRLLVQHRPGRDDGAGQAAHQPGGVDRGAVRGVGAAHDVGRADMPSRLRRVQKDVVLGAEAPRAQVRDLVPCGPQLQGRPSSDHRAALRPVDGPVLGLRHPADLVDGVEHRPLLPHRRVATGLPRQGCQAGREQGRGPAAVAAAGAEAGLLRLEDHHAQRRVLAPQVVRGPQAGVPGPDDGDVGRGVARQRTAEGLAQVVGQGVPPQRQPSQVVAHARLQART